MPAFTDLFPDSGPFRRSGPPFELTQRFADVELIGQGGMGAVYSATDPRLGRKVAVKVLKGDDPELARRFVTEARAQARVVHENVCRVYEAGELGGVPYIAMQHIEGESLSECGARMTLEQRVRVMATIARAVDEAHRHGILHRDIKPSNILVEERDDGTLVPFILDFGLAREIGNRGQTRTGDVLGTPEFMSPEQAQGDVRALSCRSDVYSLGATLFALVAGRAPFTCEHPWQLLMMVAHADPPPLGDVKEGVPVELETIVMKCLEREPSRRYASARALADDLQRFLDGARIEARPVSFEYALWKKARRHKVATALLGALLVGVLVLSGVWLHARRRAAEQARVARELGEGVKEMELFLRTAHGLPLHDVERERDLVRQRLAALSRRVEAGGEAAEGPGHHALGQGYLTLGEPRRALFHLERAAAAGYEAPELSLALGRALGELFRQELAETRRITNEDERKRAVHELTVELRDPALSHLRAAMGAQIDVPAYTEGLIALHEGKNDLAAAKAREAFDRAPWLYEAKKLEGDALYAEGSKYRHDAAFDHDRMKGYFQQAERAYDAAAAIGRSDPSVHLARCELFEKRGWAELNKMVPFEASFEAAEAACASAVAASSRDGRALVQRALVLSARAYALRSAGSEETLAVVADAVDAAEESVDARPDDVMAHYAVALALYLRAEAEHDAGREADMGAAIEAYERVLEIDPRFTWALNELGDAHLFEARRARARGGHESEHLARALRKFEEAISLDPKFALPQGGRLSALTERIEAQVERGEDAEATLRALSEAVAGLEKGGFGPWLGAYWTARLDRILAVYDLAKGRDPRPHLQAALSTIRAFAGEAPADYWFLEEKARCHLLAATYARDAGADPRPDVELARSAARRAREVGTASNPELDALAAQIEAVAASSLEKTPFGSGRSP